MVEKSIVVSGEPDFPSKAFLEKVPADLRAILSKQSQFMPELDEVSDISEEIACFPWQRGTYEGHFILNEGKMFPNGPGIFLEDRNKIMIG